jgi:aryl-alcohol dehydrogenase-like predicted oxidoreductase
MQQGELGKSGVHISTIGLGSWAIGGWIVSGKSDIWTLSSGKF